MWVVKLGGSLSESTQLKSWVDTISNHARGRAVIVPGGGLFADVVRASQKAFRFGDDVAHHMALLAMEQYGLLLCSMAKNFRPATTEADFDRIISQNDIPVWMAPTLALADKSIPTNWEVTSDSLSAWLASRLGAQVLFLVKSVVQTTQSTTVGRLITSAIVDPAFSRFADLSKYQVRIMGKDDHDLMRHALAANELCGTRVTN